MNLTGVHDGDLVAIRGPVKRRTGTWWSPGSDEVTLKRLMRIDELAHANCAPEICDNLVARRSWSSSGEARADRGNRRGSADQPPAEQCREERGRSIRDEEQIETDSLKVSRS